MGAGGRNGGLIGREAELRRLEEALDADSALVAISGEPGIGKSRLLGELAARGHQRRLLVFEGTGAEFEQEVPFGLFVDALDAFVATLPDRRLRGLSEDQRGELARVFPSLGALAGPDGSQQERYRAHHATRALLELLAAGRPCLLLLDDLQWADAASLELLAHLARRWPRGVVGVLAFRAAQAPAALTRTLRRAATRGAYDHLELGPLDATQAESLLDPSLPEGARAWIRSASGGNPFYLEQLARAASRGSLSPAAGGEWGGVPQAVLDSIEEEVAELGEPAALVLRGAAVAGDPFAPDLAAIAAQVGRDDALAAIDELVEAGLVRPAPAPAELRFRHPIVRAAVYEKAGAGWRIGAHERIARALRERGAPAPAVAHHLERCARPADGEAIELLTEAAHAVAPRAPAAAARWFGCALGLLDAGRPPGSETQSRLGLLVPLAGALGAAGRLEDSRDRLDEIVSMLPAHHVEGRVRVIGLMTVIDHLLGRHGDGRRRLEDTLRELPGDAFAQRVAVHVELASDSYFAGDWAAMHSSASAGWELASDHADDGLRATATALLALAEYSVGDIARARERLGVSRDLHERAPADGDARLDTFDWLGWCELSLEQYEHARRHFDRGLELGRRSGHGHLLTTMSLGRVFAATSAGDLAGAERAGESAVEMARVSGSDQIASWALGLQCWVMLRRGRIDQALELGEESRELAGELGANPFSAVNGGWLGETQIEAGNPEQGREQVLAALGGPELPHVERAFRPYFYEVLVRAELAAGRPGDAAAWAGRASETAGASMLDGRMAWAHIAEAQAALGREDSHAAARLAGRAAEVAAERHPFEAARAAALRGRALAAGGAREPGLRELEHARERFQALGALRHRDHAVRELRRLGRRIGRGGSRGRGTRGVAALSPREREVAELVRDRLTNREIAERLVLSEKTVERHLSSVFSKLGARSRVQVARTIERAAVSE